MSLWAETVSFPSTARGPCCVSSSCALSTPMPCFSASLLAALNHSFDRGARNFESNIPVLGSMQDEEKFSVDLRLLIHFGIGSFKLEAEVTPQKLDRLACYINMANQQRRACSLSVEWRWTMVMIDGGPG